MSDDARHSLIFESALRASIQKKVGFHLIDSNGTLADDNCLYVKKINYINNEIHFLFTERNNISSYVNSAGEISFFIDAYGFVFRSRVIKILGSELIIGMPLDHYFEERREFKRFKVFDEKVIVTFLNTKAKKECVDIGMGGFSLILSAVDNLKLKDDALIDIIITKDDKSLKFSSRKIHERKLNKYELNQFPYASKRISFIFEENKESDRILLESILERKTG